MKYLLKALFTTSASLKTVSRQAASAIVIDSDYTVEVPYIILARFHATGAIDVNTDQDEIAVDENGQAIILLFAISTKHYGRAFDPSAHVKNGKYRVKIFDVGISSSPAAARPELYRQSIQRSVDLATPEYHG